MDFQKIISKKYFFGLILAGMIVLSFYFRTDFLTHEPLRGWDETVYLNLGKQLSVTPFHYSLSQSGWSDYIPSSDPIYGWPNIGFRAPLLPYLLALLYFLRLDFLVNIIMPIIGALSVYLVHILGKNLFNRETGIYSALIFSIVPVHMYFSGQVLTDVFVVFFMLLALISFWKGYEQGDNKHKILFGLFLGLSTLARYTTLWIFPVFLLYFILRDKSFLFLKDKSLYKAVAVFFMIIAPVLIGGIVYYGNLIGFFIHGFKAAGYWGGSQSWHYFLSNSWEIFSIAGIIFILALIHIFLKKMVLKKEIYLLLLWAAFFLLMVIIMPHKEDRFIMPFLPPLALISGYFIGGLGKTKIPIISALLFGIIFVLFPNFIAKPFNKHECFEEANIFLRQSAGRDSLIITNQSPISYYYTGIKNTLYPDPWDVNRLKRAANSKERSTDTYILFSNYDMDMKSPVKADLDVNFSKIFECKKSWTYGAVYK